jgi:hypothetical protein
MYYFSTKIDLVVKKHSQRGLGPVSMCGLIETTSGRQTPPQTSWGKEI